MVRCFIYWAGLGLFWASLAGLSLAGSDIGNRLYFVVLNVPAVVGAPRTWGGPGAVGTNQGRKKSNLIECRRKKGVGEVFREDRDG